MIVVIIIMVMIIMIMTPPPITHVRLTYAAYNDVKTLAVQHTVRSINFTINQVVYISMKQVSIEINLEKASSNDNHPCRVIMSCYILWHSLWLEYVIEQTLVDTEEITRVTDWQTQHADNTKY